MTFSRLTIAVVGIAFSSGMMRAQISAEIHAVDIHPNDDTIRAPLLLTLQDAVARAKQNLPQFLAAKTDAALAHQDRVQARAAILPSINYENQFLYTQGNGTPAGVFIANNAVHEYVSQGNAHESINLAGGQIHDLRRARALEDAARAKLEIASRGLIVTITQNYYSLVVAQRKYVTAQKSFNESQKLFKITQDLERGGEVAHSDVVKAQIELNDRQRQLQDAELEMGNARLMLGVSVFPNFDQNFTVADDLGLPTELPSYSDVQTLAAKNNPELTAANSELIAANAEVGSSRSAHFPSLALDYWYGIDSTHFAVNNPDGVRNLGYAAAATLNIPIWSWGATQSKVKQAELNRDQAKMELSFTQRQLLANLQSFYREAETERAQLDLLRQSYDLASESERLVTLRYQSGEATILEVVDAQNTLAQANDTYDGAQLRFRVAIAELQTLTGAF